MTAVKQDEPQLVDYILRVTGRQDIDVENYHGDNALTIACAHGHKHIIEVLLQAGADINHETTAGKCSVVWCSVV